MPEKIISIEKIGKYELRHEVGRGAMGVVYEAWDNLNRPVALKILRVERIDPADLPAIAARFKREAESLARLVHPHIVSIHDTGEWQGLPYLVMEFMPWPDLATVLKANARLPLELVVRIMTQLLGALEHAHERGVVHAGLKPANMFLLEDGSLKVVDFGLVKIQDSAPSAPAYMSPEQVDALPADRRSDLFSAGTILYELLTGGRPFRGESTDTILQAIGKLDPLAPSDVDPTLSPVWDSVIARALAKKPSARFESARQFCVAIEEAQQAERLHAVENARADADARAAAEEMAKFDAQARAGGKAKAGAYGAAGREPGRAPLILAVVVALGVIGAALYGWQVFQDKVLQAEAARVAAETRAQNEADKRSKAETMAREESARRATLEAEVARKEAQAKLEAELAAKKAAEAQASAETEANHQAELAAKKDLEEKAKAEAAKKAEELRQAARKPGTVFQDCSGCPPMVVIPAGAFTMGSPANEQGRFASEGPQHRVIFQETFAAGRYEVTFAEWDACFRQAGCAHNPPDNGWGRGRQPAINVSWNDAKQFIAWLSRKTGKQYRLLTETEWEYVGRAGTTTAYSTGKEIASSQANFQTRKTVAAGSYRANAFGLFDVHGNAWEWTEDCWNANYNGAPADGSAWIAGDCSRRVIRGGAWDDSGRFARSSFRDRDSIDRRDASTGFRLARTLEP